MLAIPYELVWISSLRIDYSIKNDWFPLLHKTLTMLSGSCKLVWILSSGINEPSQRGKKKTVDPAEKARYEPSHMDIHYLCGYPYQSTGSEGLTSVPTCDSSI